MGPRKIQIKSMGNATSKHITFRRRRGDLVKQARELAQLCDSDVGLLIFSSSGKLFEYASSSMSAILEIYHNSRNAAGSFAPWSGDDSDMMHLQQEISRFEREQRQIKGEELSALSIEDLQQLETKIAFGLRNVRRQKDKLFAEEIEGLLRKEQELIKVNENVRRQIMELQGDPSVPSPSRCNKLLTTARETEISGPRASSTDDGQDCKSCETLLQLG